LIEREKKYEIVSESDLHDFFDETDIIKKCVFYQNYIQYKNNFECRMRKSHFILPSDLEDSYEMTFKIGEGDVREELELELTSDQFDSIFDLLPYRPLRKKRTVYALDDNLELEVDVFLEPEGIMIAEIEFQSEDQMNNYVPPDFLGAEINFKNKDIWKNMNDIYK